jgi:Ca-activated chloride channel homolog
MKLHSRIARRFLSGHRTLLLAAMLCLLIAATCASTVGADAGVLLPRGLSLPNPAILSLEEMEVTIQIDNGDARVFIRQVFANHIANVEEGTYVFALPADATVSDFAVWDGPTRIPAVILERKRAEEIYDELTRQQIDPGLLEMGERSAEEAARSSVFSAKISPIPGYGTKRLEIEYHQRITVDNLKSIFALPLHPDAYEKQSAAHFWLHFSLDSTTALKNFELVGKTYPLTLQQNDSHHVRGEFAGTSVNFAEDFAVRYDFDATKDAAHVITYRNPAPQQPSPTEMSPERSTTEPGFFEVTALIAPEKSAQARAAAPLAANDSSPPRTTIILFDASLSMQWEKLDRSYLALDHLLHALRPHDRFNVLLFNSEIAAFKSTPVAADPVAIQQSLDFVRASYLRGGTNLEAALAAGLAQCNAAGSNAASNATPAGEIDLVLISDGGATRGHVLNSTIARTYASALQNLPAAARPKLFAFAVGDDANLPLLQMLTEHNGVLQQVLSTEPIDYKLGAFISKIGTNPVGNLKLAPAPASAVEMVYPLDASTYPGSLASWVGRYEKPQHNVSFAVTGTRDAAAFDLHAHAELPSESLDHPQLPRLWARARVDALLAKIARDGEDTATIDEIIRLSREYKFVTPYTSFLAVPRALLRPRVIRPGDPVLRVKTDASISSVVALFPFGLVKPLRYLAAEDVWETRFLAPDDMRDGTYNVRLILRDTKGNTYREAKTFVIATTPPTVRIQLAQTRVRRGETLALKVNASQTTRTLVARMEGAGTIELRWNSQAAANTGELQIPADLPAGKYRLTVTAEDIAHNTGSQEIEIEVVP